MNQQELTEIFKKIVEEKLAPIMKEIKATRSDMANVHAQLESIGDRLAKMESREADVELKIDSVIRHDH